MIDAMRSPPGTIRSRAAVRLALAAALLSPIARAQAPDDSRARADALFREGQQLMTSGQLAVACGKLEESQRLDPKLGRLLNVAYCHEQLGRTATAWGEYNQAAALALQTGQSERETFARNQAGELAHKLSFVRLDLSAAPEVSQVTIGGKTLSRAECALPFPIDPGSHAAMFSAAGHKTREQTVTIREAETSRVAVAPLEAEVAAASPAPPGGAPPAAAPSEPAPVEPAPPASNSNVRTLGWIAAGAGVAALGVGTAFAVDAMSLKSQADPRCPERQCSPEGTALIDDAKTAATLATVGFAVAVVGVGVGAWLVLRSPSPGGASAQVTPYVASDRAGVALRGAW
jgi:hypothetical protein